MKNAANSSIEYWATQLDDVAYAAGGARRGLTQTGGRTLPSNNASLWSWILFALVLLVLFAVAMRLGRAAMRLGRGAPEVAPEGPHVGQVPVLRRLSEEEWAQVAKQWSEVFLKSLAPHSRLKLIAALREQDRAAEFLLLLVPPLRPRVLHVPSCCHCATKATP